MFGSGAENGLNESNSLAMIKINFLQKQSLRKKNKRIKLLVIFSYLCVWMFSIYMIIHSYTVNEFIKSNYEHEAFRIEHDIQAIKPDISTLKSLYLSIQDYRNELQTIEQNALSPLNLADRLFSIAKIIPDRIWLEEISLTIEQQKKTSVKGQPANRKMVIRGAYFLESSRPDLQYLNAFRNLLEQQGVLSLYVRDLEIVSSEITNVRNRPAVSFQIEGKWIYSHQNSGS